MKNLKRVSPKVGKFIKLSAVFILLACGPMPFDFGEYFSLFIPESSTSPALSTKYHYSPLFYYGTGSESYFYEDTPVTKLSLADSINAEAWVAYGGRGVSKMMAFNSLNSSDLGTPLEKQLRKNGKAEAADYVAFAKKIDAAIPQAPSPWEEAPEMDVNAANTLIGEAKNRVKSTNELFLKERYAFQAIKLAAEANQPDEVISIYNQLVAPLKSKSFISDWAWARKAGATMAVGDTAKAFYDFAQLFEKCPTRREEADLSVRVAATTFGEKALKFCKNENEKAAVYALWAIQPQQDGIDLLQKIIEINPAHPMVELIMAREINKNETFYFVDRNVNGYMFNIDVYDENYEVDKEKAKGVSEKSLVYFAKLREIAAKMSAEPKSQSPAFWLTAVSYIDYLKHDFDEAQKWLEKAKQAATSNEYLKQQLIYQEALLIAAQSKQLTPATEGKLLTQIEGLAATEDFRKNNFLVKLCGDMALAYKGEVPNNTKEKTGWRSWFAGCSSEKESTPTLPNGTVKAYLVECIPTFENERPFQSNYSKNYLTDNSKPDLLKAVITFIQRKDLSEIDKKLIELAKVDTDYLYLALGRSYLKDNNYADAAEALKNITLKYWDEAPFEDNFPKNPFHLIGKTNTLSQKYNPYLFVNELASLKKRVEKNPKDAEAWYMLGCGQYNLSYHGDAWIMLKRERSSVEFPGFGDTPSDDYYATKTAKMYFEKALAAQPNAELAAKICYGGALCERNQYWISYWSKYPQDYDEAKIAAYQKKAETNLLPTYRTFFTLLREKYSHTQYEKLILEECATYENYVELAAK